MKRQDPERNDLGDSSVVSDSVEIKCPFKKKSTKERLTDQTLKAQGLTTLTLQHTTSV